MRQTRNLQHDAARGRSTQQDPIGLAGGLNLYGYAGGDPINRSDPFGLCSASQDSVKVEVDVICSNTGMKGRDSVWAYRVTDPAALAQLGSQASRLRGGSGHFPPADVASAYGGVIADGAVYTIGTSSVGGHAVAVGGVAGDYPFVAFRSDYWGLIQSGSLGSTPAGAGLSAAGVLGHKGVHLVQFGRGRSQGDPRNESEALSVRWRYR